MIDLAHENDVKVMASIGGWSMCKHFPAVAADATKRQKFADYCVKLIDLGFDGIDIDWEFPGQAGLNFVGTPADYGNFTLLMQDIRDAIGPDKVLSAAFISSPSKLADFEWDKLDSIMDFYNIMAYDMGGGWNNFANHNAPLFKYGSEYSAPSISDTITYLKDAIGIDPEKINVGLAFYGRSVETAGTPFVKAPTLKKIKLFEVDGQVDTAGDLVNFPKLEGNPYYSHILKVIEGGEWTEEWDDVAKVPYLVHSTKNFFLSYDNEESIEIKARHYADENIGGVIVWQIFSDWELDIGAQTDVKGNGKYPVHEGIKTPLINRLNKVFNETAPKQ